jgi:phosphopentomutase
VEPFRQIICIVLDGVGVGEAPDAAAYGDAGSNSLGNAARHVGSLRLPVLGSMGLGHVTEIPGVAPAQEPIACFGRMRPVARGKDSTSGHWELMGCVLDQPFPTYPDGFPRALIDAFERAIARRVIGNRPASGTEVIEELGEEHVRTGSVIVYTSQDSVFQVAAHEDVVSTDELHRMCRVARALLAPPHAVARVIARPFAGAAGGFYRTAGRKDFSVAPLRDTVLDALAKQGRDVLAIGKIDDLFCGRGITVSVPTHNNREGMQATLAAAHEARWALVFVNLVDFDTMWGHRNDPRAYALGLEEFDSYLNDLVESLGERTLLVITSDHGNDPTTESTDHSREYVPLIAYAKGMSRPADLGTRETLADVGATIAENFRLHEDFPGTSFLERVSL